MSPTKFAPTQEGTGQILMADFPINRVAETHAKRLGGQDLTSQSGIRGQIKWSKQTIQDRPKRQISTTGLRDRALASRDRSAVGFPRTEQKGCCQSQNWRRRKVSADRCPGQTVPSVKSDARDRRTAQDQGTGQISTAGLRGCKQQEGHKQQAG
jgi:hypothetical protein